MFLNTLSKEEKKIFGSMIYKIAHIDGELAEEENELLNNFKLELEIDELDAYDISLDDAIESLAKASNVVKRSMFLEIVSLVLSDEEITSEETDIINKISIKFEIEQDKELFFKTVNELQTVYGKLFDIVFVD